MPSAQPIQQEKSEKVEKKVKQKHKKMKNLSELTTALPLSLTSVPIPSSPVEQGDLYDYILWHIKITPRLKFQFRHAYNILEDKCYDLQTIQQWKGTAYEEK